MNEHPPQAARARSPAWATHAERRALADEYAHLVFAVHVRKGAIFGCEHLGEFVWKNAELFRDALRLLAAVDEPTEAEEAVRLSLWRYDKRRGSPICACSAKTGDACKYHGDLARAAIAAIREKAEKGDSP